MIYCGLQAIDGDTGQVGPETAELLGIPQITFAETVEIVYDDMIKVKQQTEDGMRILQASFPLLVTCIPPPSFLPRIAPLKGIIKAREKPLEVWTNREIGANPAELGLKGSPTQVRRTYSPPPRGKVRMITGSTSEAARKLSDLLVEKKLLREVN
jgi:electron transfer flavoprotein beta subunit